jgi:NTP pyrophosphatase (non-canonical NTP hydrolase)
MNQHLIDTIRQLSKQDSKTLSQKALKTAEEVGELAKVVLPFDGAFATNHRFVERERILEEAVDTTLCALSVAYSLDFSDEEIEDMIALKAEKWAMLQRKEQDIKYPLPYEIHVTVKAPPGLQQSWLTHFREICAELKVKPIVLNLSSGQKLLSDVMTSSKHFGTNSSAYYAAKHIENGLVTEGFKVERVKIETVPWHPAAPIADQPMPLNCYFESHIPVELEESKLQLLRDWMELTGLQRTLHMSRNAFKRDERGFITQMLTYREYTGSREQFEARLDTIVTILTARWDIGKVITEFSVYDTKVSHDSSWLNKAD